MRVPIRYQLMIPLLAVALASLAAVAIINAGVATWRTRERVEHQLRGVAAVMAQGRFQLTDAVLRQMGDLAGAEFLLATEAGEPLAASYPGALAAPSPAGPAAGRTEDVVLGSPLNIGGKAYLHSSLRLAPRAPEAEPTRLHILFPREQYDLAWRAVFLPPLLIGLATIVAVVGVTHLVASRISRSLKGLGEEVRRLARGDFSPVQAPTADDEIKDLALAVNDTAQQLAAYEREVRQTERTRTLAIVGAGLAHEIRNAATGCRMAVDLHAEACGALSSGAGGPNAGGPEDDSLEVARRQLTLIERRLCQLLQLGRSDPTGSPAGNPARFDLARLVSELVSLVRPSADHAGILLEWREPAEPMPALADQELLSQSIMNLLLNALDAARKSGVSSHQPAQVGVELARCDGGLELTVTDSGGGPPASLGGSLFDPFTTDKPEGVGLGLAVARRGVESCAGTIDWRRHNGQTQFLIRMPAAPEEAICA